MCGTDNEANSYFMSKIFVQFYISFYLPIIYLLDFFAIYGKTMFMMQLSYLFRLNCFDCNYKSTEETRGRLCITNCA